MNDLIRLDDLSCKSTTLASHPDCCNTFFSNPAGLVIVKITKDGRLEKGPGLSDDAASLLFFDACQKVFSNAADELRDLRAAVAEEIRANATLEAELLAERADKIKWAKALLVSMESLADDNPDHWASDESRKHYAELTIAAVREEIGQLEGDSK